MQEERGDSLSKTPYAHKKATAKKRKILQKDKNPQ